MSSANQANAILNLVMLCTGHHSDSVKDVLTQLAEQIDVNAKQSVHLINGIGAKSTNPANPMIGTYDFSCEYNPATGEIHATKIAKKKQTKLRSLNGLITGAGFHSAMDEALTVIKSMLEAGKAPLMINMYGFSRASDTWVRLSNIINNLYSRAEITINIFAIDPVAGFGRRFARKARYIPENIDEYESVLMKNERRQEFEPQDRSLLLTQAPDKTKISHHIYNGNHDAATVSRNFHKPHEVEICCQLLWDDIQDFARRHGTKLKDGKALAYIQKNTHDHNPKTRFKTVDGICKLSIETRLLLYSKMMVDEKLLHSSRKKLGSSRDFLHKQIDYLLHGLDFFQDKFHMELFKQVYPSFFDYFFQKNLEQASEESVFKDLFYMHKNDPDLIQLLEKYLPELSHLNSLKALKAIGPRGINVSTAIYENKKLMFKWESIKEAANRTILLSTNALTRHKVKKLLKNCYAILTSSKTELEKLQQMENAVTLTIKHIPKKSRFIKYLQNTLSIVSVKINPAQMILASIQNAINHNRLHFIGSSHSLSNTQNKIAFALMQYLQHLQTLGCCDDVNEIKQAIQVCLRTNNMIASLTSLVLSRKNKMDSILRDNLLKLNNFTEKSPSDSESDAFLKLYAELALILNDHSPQDMTMNSKIIYS